jgi:hypothetical protein
MQLRRVLLLLATATTTVLAGCGSNEQRIDPAVRAATFRFADTVAPGDREWILAAVDQARPEARQLIDDIDGMVTISTFSEADGRAVGMMRPVGEGQYEVTFNLAYLDGERKLDRDSTVVHELGHVVDHALLTDDVTAALDAGIPAGLGCEEGLLGACANRQERFAESFAKWALGDIGVNLDIGYKVPPPSPPLDVWGAPLARLAESA